MNDEILVVDDDANLREVVRYALSREGFRVREASNGREAVAMFEDHPSDLVVLDVMMPDQDGLETCRRLRAASAVPIVFLSSRGEEVDRIVGLELGGDDYVSKPFSPRELVSRVKAVLRRTRPAPTSPSDGLAIGALRLDLDGARCFVGETLVPLTVTELRLLAVLVRRVGRVVERRELVANAYPGRHHVSERTLDSHIRNIRQKLRDAGLEAIETVHGLGFRLDG